MKTFAIYGDNIVECERMIDLLKSSLHASNVSVSGTAPAPSFSMDTPSGRHVFHCYPGFGRWEHDIVAAMRNSGSVLRETPDVVMTSVADGKESPILALEFCSALPAGNQAWQRSGRAYSTARCGVPYLFVAEIGGHELDKNRNKKARRLPNPAVPYSFISRSAGSRSDVLAAYTMNPGADESSRKKHATEIAGDDLFDFIASKVAGRDSAEPSASLENKLFSFVLTASRERKSERKNLKERQWREAHESLVRENDPAALYRNFRLPWRKRTSIPTTDRFGGFLHSVEDFAIAAGSGDLPFCIVGDGSTENLKSLLRQFYPDFFREIPEADIGSSDMAICWINGFKPSGEDARPDRGLPPLLRMLVGDSIKVLTVVYGPTPRWMVDELRADPRRLADKNGLWESVLALSDFVICDSTQADRYVCQKGWGDALSAPVGATPVAIPANARHFPEEDRLGEHDVDSVIHMLFAHVLDGKCFEAMCNPPGGDWSGISLVAGGREYRWLTLPRVSASRSKRPDHVVQFGEGPVLAIESKDRFRNLEKDIGDRLVRYCTDLFATPPSCARTPGGDWSDQTGGFTPPNTAYASAAAFMETSPSDRDEALSHAKTDVVFLVSFTDDVSTVRIKFGPDCDPVVRDVLSNASVPDDLKMEIELLD